MSDRLGKTKSSRPELIILLLFLSLAGYVYVGFYFPDPEALARFKPFYVGLISWGARILIPVSVLGILRLYRSVKKGKLSPGQAMLPFAGIILGLFLVFPFVTYFYEKALRGPDKLQEYHPYFQLNPPRLPDSSRTAAPGRSVLMCLGGSTTQFKDPDGRDWPSRVEAALRRRYENEKIDVLNMGMMWYTSLHSLMNYAVNLRSARPRAVLVMHAINDLLQNADFSYFSRGPFREDYGHFYGPLKNLVSRRSLPETILEMLGDFWYAKPRQVIDQTDFPGLVPFKRNINSLIDLAETDGTRVVLMTQPYLLKDHFAAEEKAAFHMVNTEAIGKGKRWSVATAVRGMKAYNDALREIARQRDVPLIDLEPHIPKTLEYFSDEVHYRQKTFDIIGFYVAEELIRLNIFDAEASRPAPSFGKSSQDREDQGGKSEA